MRFLLPWFVIYWELNGLLAVPALKAGLAHAEVVVHEGHLVAGAAILAGPVPARGARPKVPIL